MTKKHYSNIADAIKRTVDETNARYQHDRPAERTAVLHTLWVSAVRIADVMEADNPRFDRDTFMKACGFDA